MKHMMSTYAHESFGKNKEGNKQLLYSLFIKKKRKQKKSVKYFFAFSYFLIDNRNYEE